MKAVIVWRRESDYGREVEEWLREFERRTGRELTSLNPDEGDGESFCRAYDIVEYPTIVVADENGAPLAMWRGQNLPTFDEVLLWLMK